MLTTAERQTSLLPFLRLCRGWELGAQWHYFIHLFIMFSLGFHPSLQSFCGSQHIYGAVVPHNPSAARAAWQSCCCYGCQTHCLCPLASGCFKNLSGCRPTAGLFTGARKLTSRGSLVFTNGSVTSNSLKQRDPVEGELQRQGEHGQGHVCNMSAVTGLKQTYQSCSCLIITPVLQLRIYPHHKVQ